VRAALACLLVCAALGAVGAGDWATYMHDNARSGVTSERLDLPLSALWVFEPKQPPAPAWALMKPKETYSWGKHEVHKYDFDEAYHVAVADGLVYFGSSANHKLYCLDAETGRVRWSVFAGGPIRFAPTVWQGKVYFGADDGVVYCLDATSGRPLWQFKAAPGDSMLLANGKMISRWPIRTGVLVDRGIAYFGAGIIPAEDTLLYAVDAATGRLVWRNDEWSHARHGWGSASPQGYMLASDRFLFVPCGRAAPAVFDRRDGRFLYQMRGGQHWRDIVGGTFAVLWDKYLFGCGQTVRAYEQATGKVGFAWFPGRRLLVADGKFFLLGSRKLTALDVEVAPAAGWKYMHMHHPLALGIYEKQSEKGREAIRKRQAVDKLMRELRQRIERIARRLAAAKEETEEVVALRQYREKLIKQYEAARKEHSRIEKEELEEVRKEFRREKRQSEELWQKATVWQNTCRCPHAMIYSGGVVFAGGKEKVVAIDARSGQTLWTARVAGTAKGLAAAAGSLFVSSDNGNIYCFGTKAARGPARVSEPVVENPYAAGADDRDDCAKLAEQIIELSGVRRGYCLHLGCGDGRLAFELVRRTELAVYGIEPDRRLVQAAREKLAAAGLYGSRVTVHPGSLTRLPYSDYCANLIISSGTLRSGRPVVSTPELFRCLKPCGGVALIGWPQQQLQNRSERAAALKRWLAAVPRDQAQVEIIDRGGLWARIVRGPLPGAGRWTHQYANPANTASTKDQRVRWPLRLLWYGSPGPTRVLHKLQPSPLVAGGRFYLEENNVVMAYDCYNGVRLWQRDLAGAAWGNPERGCNIACDDKDFFVAVGEECMRLAGETGRTEAVYRAPARTRWRDIRILDGTLIGVCIGGEPTERERRRGIKKTEADRREAIVAIDVATGEVRWQRPCNGIDPSTVAIGDGRIFFTEKELSEEERSRLLQGVPVKERPLRDLRRVVAIDARTGQTRWTTLLDTTECCLPRRSGRDTLHVIYKDGVVLLFGAFWNNHFWGDLCAGRLSGRNMKALSAGDGRLLWSGLKYESRPLGYLTRPCVVGSTIYAHPWAFDLKTGRQVMVSHPITGERIPFQFGRGHHCGLPAGCPRLLTMRSLTTAFIDLVNYTGTIHFYGQRAGCHINMVPAAGLVIVPEASSGCVCPVAVQATVVFQPCEKSQETMWGTYSGKWKAVDSKGPHWVKSLAVNLGAPGDRRSTDGTLWLAHPRPGGNPLELSFDFQVHFLAVKTKPAQELVIHKAVYGVLEDPRKTIDVTAAVARLVKDGTLVLTVGNQLGGDPASGVNKKLRVEYSLEGERQTAVVPEYGFLQIPKADPYFYHNPRITPIKGTSDPWIFSYGCLGVSRCVIPHTEPGAAYTVRLYFRDPANDQPGKRVFDIKVQDKVVAEDFDIVKETGGANIALVKEFRGIRATDRLTIEFLPKPPVPTIEQAPVLCGIQAVREARNK